MTAHQHCTTCDWTRNQTFPDPKLTPTERRQHERAQRHRDNLKHLLTHLTDPVLAELIRRSREPAADGYTTATGGAGNDISRPTETVAVRDAGGRGDEPDTWPTIDDHVAKAINNVLNQLAEAAGVLQLADKQRAYVFAIADKAAGRISSLAGQCARCHTSVTGAVGDKLVSGYCGRCRKAWERAGYPDRLQFEQGYTQADQQAS